MCVCVCVIVCDYNLLNVSDSLLLGGAGNRISQLWHIMTLSVMGLFVSPQKMCGRLRPSTCEHDFGVGFLQVQSSEDEVILYSCGP